MTDFPRLSQKALSGGVSNPMWTKLAPSSKKGCRSQCFSFQRLKASLNQFMPGLRGRSVWKQNDSTECPGATLRPG
ncbi:hypothetical protein CPZ93_04375 [Pseudomonas aeruginosa]|nr:hypothetical protein CPZ93_04375 [Pseudomonas aeruginosa]